MRRSEGRIRMKESQIFNIKIPAYYQHQEGVGGMSGAEKFKQSLMNLGRGDLDSLLSSGSTNLNNEETEIINIATKFLSNGRPSEINGPMKMKNHSVNPLTILTTSTTTAHPVINSPSETEASTLPFQPETTTTISATSTLAPTIKSIIKVTTSSPSLATITTSTTSPTQLLTRLPLSTPFITQQLMRPLTLYHPTFIIPYSNTNYHSEHFPPQKKFIIPASTNLLRYSVPHNVFSHFNPFTMFRFKYPFYGR